MPILLRLGKKQRATKRLTVVLRRKAALAPILLPEEIALESAILAAAARDVANLHR